MSCLPCFSKHEKGEGVDQTEQHKKDDSPKAADPSLSNAKSFTFRELAVATKNFRQESLIGEGGFGRVFKGKLQSNEQIVAVKQLDRNGRLPNEEFIDAAIMLSLLQHPNLVSLIGYCADGDQRLLVFEYVEMGSLEDHLFGDDPEKKMDWYNRMKIAVGAAQGLEYLHDSAKPSIIYRDLKPSNILLDASYEPKLSDYGLAKFGGGEGKMNPTSRVMGTYGYSAPEYSSSGEVTLKSDVYSFGVIFLELLTGKRVIDTTRPNDEQNLVTWAQPIFRDPKRFPDLADPCLNKEFPTTAINQAVGICAMCLQEEATVRPLISDVVAALSFLAIPQPKAIPASIPTVQKQTPPPEQKMHFGNNNQNHDNDRSSSSSSSDNEDDEESFDKNSKDGSNSTFHHWHSADENSDGESISSNAEKRDNSRLSRDNSKSDGESLSSFHGSSRGSSPTKRTGRKKVVTFKEPNLNSRRNGGRKSEEGNVSSHGEQRNSWSSSESCSESEDERETS